MMKAGTYYIGDLCYVMHPEWDEYCDITIKGHDCLDGEFQLADGRKFATYGTAYGDGCYPASNGSNLSVDAGLIGCILVEDIRDDITMDAMKRLGTIVTFETSFVTGESDGTIKFGHITVETGDEEEDEYEGYDNDYNEEEEDA
jgi:hypothetical protein